MRLCRLLTTAAILCSAASVPAFADDLFTFTGPDYTVSFELPETPTITSIGSCHASDFTGAFCIEGVTVTVDGVTSVDDLSFFNEDNGGGFVIVTQDPNTLLNEFGDELYSGSLGLPTFKQGKFSLSDTGPGGGAILSGGGELTITSADAPEPSTLALLGTGMVGLVAGVRRRLA